jgi:hypothetical protein
MGSRNSYYLVTFLLTLIIVALPGIGQAFADSLKNASSQRMGNYDMQLATDPKNPVVGTPTRIQVRIAGVNGDELMNVPIQIRLTDNQGKVLQYSSPIIVPAGHYAYSYTFSEPGRYIVYVDLNDNSYSNSVLTYTFFINVAGPFDFLFNVIAAVGGTAAAGIVGSTILIKRRRKQKQMETDLR